MNNRKMSSSPAAVFQIQPRSDSFDAWNALAAAEDLFFEVMELSTPPALNESGRFQTCLDLHRQSGRVRSVHGAFIDVNPASSDAKMRELSRTRCRESCAAAVRMGASNIVFHSSILPFLGGAFADNWAGICAEFYEELAEEFPLSIFIENSQDVTPSPIRKLMNRITSPRIGVCLDLGHANYSRVSAEKWFEDLGERIGYLHLSDNLGLYDDHLPLGKGIVEWEKVHEFWKNSGKTMYMTFETGGLEGTEESIMYLKEHRYFGM